MKSFFSHPTILQKIYLYGYRHINYQFGWVGRILFIDFHSIVENSGNQTLSLIIEH